MDFFRCVYKRGWYTFKDDSSLFQIVKADG